MRAILFAKTGQLSGAKYEISGEATIGKGAENNITLNPSPISGKHARIYFDNKANAFFVEDLKSKNGTWVDGMRVTGKERLDKLSVITFAKSFDFVFQVLEGSTRPVAEPAKPVTIAKPVQRPDVKTVLDAGFTPLPGPGTGHPTPPPVPVDNGKTVVGADFGFMPELQKEPVGSGAKTIVGEDFIAPPGIVPQIGVATPAPAGSPVFALLFNDLKGQVRSFSLKEGENTVGRAETCEVRIDDASLSRTHAVVTLRNGKVLVKDLGSKNHTLVDNTRIVSEVEASPGMEIVFGLVAATLVKM